MVAPRLASHKGSKSLDNLVRESEAVRVHLATLTIVHDRFPTRAAYPFHLPLFQQTTTVPVDAPVTLFVGENGSGKSTLLTAIARRADIHIWENRERSRSHCNPHAECLCDCLDLRWTAGPKPGSFFSAENFRHFAELVDAWAASDPGLFGYFGGGSLTEKSHGQCNMAFFGSRYGVEGLYLLDEPESALSPRRQMELRDIIGRAASHGQAQFIVATHSPILLSLPGARILSFDGASVQPVAFEDTDHLRFYRDFFASLARTRRAAPAG